MYIRSCVTSSCSLVPRIGADLRCGARKDLSATSIGDERRAACKTSCEKAQQDKLDRNDSDKIQGQDWADQEQRRDEYGCYIHRPRDYSLVEPAPGRVTAAIWIGRRSRLEATESQY